MLEIKQLLVERQKEPLGIDIRNPAFSWYLESDMQGVMQQAYQIQVVNLDSIFWDSGVVTSEECISIKYEGKALEELSAYCVYITVWSSTGEMVSCETVFETAFFDANKFTARWIETGQPGDANPCQVFRKDFRIHGKITRARLYVSACGVYDVMLNGLKAGDAFLAPGWTDYNNRILYQIYDVTKMLKSENTLDITAAPGWFSGDYGGEGRTKNYGERPAVFGELRVWREGNHVDVITTDGSWACGTGPVLYSEIYHGETIDNRKEIFCPHAVKVVDIGNAQLSAQQSPQVKIMQTLKAKSLIITPKGETVIDFGQNISGFVELRLIGQEGQVITVQHGEVLDKEGNFYRDNLRTAKASDTFICKEGYQTFRPRFTFHGFRYIKIDGLGTEVPLSDIQACALHTEINDTAQFQCSNPLVNQLWSNIKWSMFDNFVDIPTDCPQRDERLGWTGDATAFIGTAAHIGNVYLFFKKWLKDLAGQQSDEYGVPHMIPNIMGPHGGAAMWSDSATIIPWTLFNFYGDKSILEDQFDSMKQWVEFMRRQETPDHLRKSGHQYGDWLALDKEELLKRPMGATDPYFIASAFYAYSTDILSKAAAAIGRDDDARRYRDLHQKIRQGFQREYITSTGRLVCETQTALILALSFDLVPAKFRDQVRDRLVSNIKAHNGHLTTGFIGTPFAANALSLSGAHAVAGEILLNEEYPGWLNEVKLGATTIWERWNSMLPDGSIDQSGMNSFNHYAFGSIGAWMVEQLAGINYAKPGYKEILIKPQFIAGITEVSAKRLTPYGEITCSWKCINGEITIDVTIPVNTKARLYLPEIDGYEIIGSGKHHFNYKTGTNLAPALFSMKSNLGDILDIPETVDIVEKYMPGSVNHSMIDFLKSKSLNEIASMTPEGDSSILESMVKELNDRICTGSSHQEKISQ